MRRKKKRPTASRAEIRSLAVQPLTQQQIEVILSLRDREPGMSDRRMEDIAAIVAKCQAARAYIDPMIGILLDDRIAAADPKLLIREARILIDGMEAILEDLRACCDLREFDILEALLNLSRERLAEIKKALAPLLSSPS